MVLKKLLKMLGRMTDPRPKTLDEWMRAHRPRVEKDVESILQFVPEGGRFVDVGANVGMFTECLRSRRPGCEAFLFEPVREYFDHCKGRFAGDPLVHVFNVGVGPEPEARTIYKFEHNYGGNTVVEEIVFDRGEQAHFQPDSVYQTEEIQLVNFSTFAAEHGIGDVDFVKTDAEGFDYAVLTSMLPWLRERTRLPVILSELLSPNFHPHPDEQAAVVRELVELGYRDVDLPTHPKVFDVVFTPR